MGKLTLPDALDHLQLLLGQCQLLIIVLIVQRPPGRVIIIALDESIQPITLLGLPYKLLTLPIIPNVVLISVPLEWDITNCRQPMSRPQTSSAPRTTVKDQVIKAGEVYMRGRDKEAMQLSPRDN